MPHRDGPRPHVLIDGWALIIRATRVALRNPVLPMMATFFPLILLVLMTVSFGSLVVPGGSGRTT